MPPPGPHFSSLWDTSVPDVPCNPSAVSKPDAATFTLFPIGQLCSLAVVTLSDSTGLLLCHFGLPLLSRPQVPPIPTGPRSSHLTPLHLFLYHHHHYDISSLDRISGPSPVSLPPVLHLLPHVLHVVTSNLFYSQLSSCSPGPEPARTPQSLSRFGLHLHCHLRRAVTKCPWALGWVQPAFRASQAWLLPTVLLPT